MEKNLENNNGILKLLLAIFIIATLALGGFVVYDKVLKKDNTDVPVKETEENKVEEKSSLPDWANYLLNQNINKVGYYDSEDWKDITMDQLKGYLQKLTTEYSLIKMHDYDGGCSNYCGLEIKYNNNDFRIYAGSIFFENDSTLLSLLEKDKYTLYDIETNYDTWHYGYARNIKGNGFDTLEINDYMKEQ